MLRKIGFFISHFMSKKNHPFFFSLLILVTCLSSALGAGYSCPTQKVYSSCNAGYYLSSGTCSLCPSGYTSAGNNKSGQTSCYKSCSVACTKGACPANATCSYGNSDATGTQYYGSSCSATAKTCPITINCNKGYTKSGSTCSCTTSCTSVANRTTTQSCTPSNSVSNAYTTNCPAGTKTCASNYTGGGCSSAGDTCTGCSTYGSCSTTCTARSCNAGYYLSNGACSKCDSGYSSSNGNTGGRTSCTKSCSVSCKQQTCPANATCTHGSETASGTENYGGSCNAVQGTCSINITCNSGYYKTTDNKCEKCPANSYCSGNAKSSCPGTYPYSDAGASSQNNCYKTATKYGTQITPSTVPTNCSKVTAWNDCSVGSCEYRVYKSGTTTSCTATDCNKTAKTVEAKVNYYVSGASCSSCPATYPKSAGGAIGQDKCYKEVTKNGTQKDPTMPTGCAGRSLTACNVGSCTYKDYYSGTDENCTPQDCTKTQTCTSASPNYYLENGSAKSCSTVSGGTYPKSDGGNITNANCYKMATKNGVQKQGTIPSGCASVTEWNACTTKSCEYKDYYTAQDGTCTPTDCTQTVKSVKANAGYYVKGSVCETCPNGSYCPGGTYTVGTSNQGINSCPSGASGSNSTKSAITHCYKNCSTKTITGGTATLTSSIVQYNASTSSYPACTYTVKCDAGYGASGNSTADPKCTQCTAGTYSAGGTATCQNCAAGTYNSSAGQSSCSACGTDYYCPGGSTHTSCGTGRTTNGKTDATAATACVCKAGYYNNSGGVCSACAAGTYKSAVGDAASCTACPANSTTAGTGSTSQSACTCKAGYGGNATNGTCTACGIGKYKGSGNTSCSACPSNSTTTGTTSAAQSACLCNAGYSGSAASGNGTCALCVAGTYKASASNGDCTSASAGHYVSGTGKTSQSACSGTTQYQDATGQSSCKNVSAGFYKKSDSAQEQCPANYRDGSAASAITGCTASCAAGTHVTTKNGACVVVSGNNYMTKHSVKYGDVSGSVTACISGYSISGDKATDHDDQTDCKITCAAGKYIPKAGGGCVQCPANSYCGAVTKNQTETAGATSCPTNYPHSMAGAGAVTSCWSDTRKRIWTGTQTTPTVPAGCYTQTLNDCSIAACDYTMYANSAGTGDGTLHDGCSTNNNSCTKTVKSVTAKAGFYVNGKSCSACAGGYTSTQGNTATSAGAACYVTVPAGSYLTTAGTTTTASCANWTYSGSHNVYQGNTDSCTSCPTVTSGWNKKTGTGWTALTSCVQTQTPSGCTSGTVKQVAATASTWGATQADTTLSASTNHYVSGNTCPVCSGTYTLSDGGQISASGCYATQTVTGTCKNETVPSGCANATFTPGKQTTCNWRKYSDGSGAPCTPAACTNTIATLTANVDHYVYNKTCPACPDTYPKSGGGNIVEGRCYKITTETKECTNAAVPAGCKSATWTPTAAKTCTWYQYKDASGTKCVPDSCTNPVKTVVAKSGYYAGTNATSCTQCPGSGTSADGATAETNCYVNCSAKNINNGSTAVVNDKEYYSSSSKTYPACTYTVSCDSGYGADGNKTTSPSCTQCTAGNYSAGGANACKACDAGTYNNAVGQSSCNNCGTDYYCTGGKSRVKCDATRTTNTTTNAKNASACVCRPGYTGTDGNAACSACQSGTYKSASGNIACTNASAGYYVSGTGKTSQSACDKGTYTGTQGQSACTQCTGAKYQDATGQSSCKDCPTADSGWSLGSGTAWQAITSCYETQTPVNCARGKIQKNATASGTWGTAVVSSALTANTGYYVSSTSCAACTKKPENSTYTSNGGTTDSCQWVCNDGYGQTFQSKCILKCTAGMSTLHAGEKVAVQLYDTRSTTPSIVIQKDAKMCYVNLVEGNGKNALNVDYKGTVYHTSN